MQDYTKGEKGKPQAGQHHEDVLSHMVTSKQATIGERDATKKNKKGPKD